MSKPTPPAPTESAIGPCPTIIKIVGRPGEGKIKKMTDEGKKCPNNPIRTYADAVGHPQLRLTLTQISKTPQHWKFTQHHRTTRPPREQLEVAP